MNRHNIVNLKCPCFLFRYPNLDMPSQALFNHHRASALPLRCGSEDDKNFQNPTGHSRQPVKRRRYCMVSVWHSVEGLQSTGLPSLVYSVDYMYKILNIWYGPLWTFLNQLIKLSSSKDKFTELVKTTIFIFVPPLPDSKYPSEGSRTYEECSKNMWT